MPREPQLTRAAMNDLADIWRWIAGAAGAARADDVVRRLNAALKLLGERPRAGPPRPNLSPKLRSWTVRPFVILYLIDGERVTAARTVHGARNLGRLFTDEPAGDG
jgi:plasmid stabilization system protein ParE